MPNYSFELIADCAAYQLHEWYGFRASVAQVRTFLERHPDLLEDMQERCIDTSNREWMLDELSWELGVGPWPCNEDSTATKIAHAKLFHERATAAGWKLRDGWLDDMVAEALENWEGFIK